MFVLILLTETHNKHGRMQEQQTQPIYNSWTNGTCASKDSSFNESETEAENVIWIVTVLFLLSINKKNKYLLQRITHYFQN